MKRTFFSHYEKLMQQFIDGVSSPILQTAEELTEVLYQKYDVEDQHLAIDLGWIPVEEYYRKTVIPHKIAVYDAGFGIMRHMDYYSSIQLHQRLIVHDFSKFSCEEHIGYSQYDFKDKSKNNEISKMNFESAWHHHKQNNDHHPEHWLSVNRDGSTEPLVMPKLAIYEMVADWIGAGRSYGSTLEAWLPNNIHTFVFHPTTARVVGTFLSSVTGMDLRHDGNKVVLIPQKD